MADICGASDHVVNAYCKDVEGNRIYQMSLLDVDRIFPTSGIVVQDQSYVIPAAMIPIGKFEAVSPDVDSVTRPCYIHTEDDLPEEEEEGQEIAGGGFNLGELLGTLTGGLIG